MRAFSEIRDSRRNRKYLTYENYRYIHHLSIFERYYNEIVHGATGMAPTKVTDSDIIAIWNRMRARQSTVKGEVVKFWAGQHVRISK